MYLIGLDWSEKKHMVCIMNQDGRHLAIFDIPHSPEGFTRLETEVRKLGATPEQCLVAVLRELASLSACPAQAGLRNFIYLPYLEVQQ